MQNARTWSARCALGAIASALALVLVACKGEGGEPIDAVGLAQETPLPKRKGTVLVDGCAIDPFQDATLSAPGTRKIVDEVLLHCLVPRDNGALGPADSSARGALRRTIEELHLKGYKVSLGVAFTDETGARYDPSRTAQLVGEPTFRATFAESLVAVANTADAVDLDLLGVPQGSRVNVTALVREVSPKLRDAKKTLGIFIPPSVATPSDLPDGEAFDRASLAPLVDRFRVMTLDYSETPGPTTDPGWATDAVRLAQNAKRETYVSLPLYGVDFGPRGLRGVSVVEARGLAATYGATLSRGATGSQFFSYVALGEPHEVWFDDTASTAQALGAFATSLPRDVGVLYYGFGAEDPSLFSSIAERTE